MLFPRISWSLLHLPCILLAAQSLLAQMAAQETNAASVSPTLPAAPDKPAHPTVFVDKPQMAVVWLSDNKPHRLWVERLTSEELNAKSSYAAKADRKWQAKDRYVRGIQLANGDTFALHPKTNRFAKYDPLKRNFVEDKAEQEEVRKPEMITEVADGVGATVEEATQDALRNAVRLAVGVVIDDEVMIQKEDVISDKILTYSAGFIAKYDVVSRTQEKGLFKVRVSAEVENRKLLADLRKAQVSLSSADGKDLAASALSRKEARDSAAVLLSKKLAELPNLIDIEVHQPKPLDFDADTQILSLLCDIRVNLDKYRIYADALESLAKKLAVAQTSTVVRMQTSFGATGYLLDWSQLVMPPQLRFGPDLRGSPKTWCLWLISRCDCHVHTARLSCFVFDADFARSLEGIRGQAQAQVNLVDANGQVVAQDAFDSLSEFPRQPYWLGWLAARPRLLDSLPQNDDLGYLSKQINSQNSAFTVSDDGTVNAYVLPGCVTTLEKGVGVFARGVWQARKLKITPESLQRMTQIQAKVVFKPATTATMKTDKK